MRSLHTSYSGNVFYQASWFRLLTAGVTATAKKVATEYINQFHSFSSSVNFSSGTEEFPEPVNIRLRSLQSLVDVRYLPLSVVQDCPGLQTAKRMMELKGIVEYGLKNYPSWIGAEKNLTSLLREVPAVKIWPTGYYGFLKTNDGCPGEWASGKRFHDTANGGMYKQRHRAPCPKKQRSRVNKRPSAYRKHYTAPALVSPIIWMTFTEIPDLNKLQTLHWVLH